MIVTITSETMVEARCPNQADKTAKTKLANPAAATALSSTSLTT
jgi:hypothetical protein